MSIVPSWVYWLAIAALGAVVAGQEARVQIAKTETEKVRREWSEDREARHDAALRLVEFNAKLQSEHAAAQQESEDAFNKEKLALERRVRDGSATAERLRAQLAAYTTRGGAGGETDAVACERARDRLEALGGLFAEGVELLVEGRGIVERRDAEVKRLVDQVTADRATVEISDPQSKL